MLEFSALACQFSMFHEYSVEFLLSIVIFRCGTITHQHIECDIGLVPPGVHEGHAGLRSFLCEIFEL